MWSQCLDPPEIRNLVSHWNRKPVDFGGYVTYSCVPGYYFRDRNKAYTKAKCLPDGSYSKAELEICIQGEIYIF